MKELAYFFCRESQQASAYIYIYGTCNAYHIFGQCPGIYVVTPGVTTRWFSYDGEEDTPRELYYNKNLSDMIQNWHTNAIYLNGILSTAWLPITTLNITIRVFKQYVCTMEIHTYTAGTILQTRKDDQFINHNHAKIFIFLYTIWSINYTYIHLHVNDVVSWILTDTSFIFCIGNFSRGFKLKSACIL